MAIIDLNLNNRSLYENSFWDAIEKRRVELRNSNGNIQLVYLDPLLSNDREGKYNIFYGALSLADSLTLNVGTPARVGLMQKLDMNSFVPDYLERLNEGLVRRGTKPIELPNVETGPEALIGSGVGDNGR